MSACSDTTRVSSKYTLRNGHLSLPEPLPEIIRRGENETQLPPWAPWNFCQNIPREQCRSNLNALGLNQESKKSYGPHLGRHGAGRKVAAAQQLVGPDGRADRHLLRVRQAPFRAQGQPRAPTQHTWPSMQSQFCFGIPWGRPWGFASSPEGYSFKPGGPPRGAVKHCTFLAGHSRGSNTAGASVSSSSTVRSPPARPAARRPRPARPRSTKHLLWKTQILRRLGGLKTPVLKRPQAASCAHPQRRTPHTLRHASFTLPNSSAFLSTACLGRSQEITYQHERLSPV